MEDALFLVTHMVSLNDHEWNNEERRWCEVKKRCLIQGASDVPGYKYFYRLPLGKSLLARDKFTSFLVVGVTTLMLVPASATQ